MASHSEAVTAATSPVISQQSSSSQKTSRYNPQFQRGPSKDVEEHVRLEDDAPFEESRPKRPRKDKTRKDKKEKKEKRKKTTVHTDPTPGELLARELENEVEDIHAQHALTHNCEEESMLPDAVAKREENLNAACQLGKSFPIPPLINIDILSF